MDIVNVSYIFATFNALLFTATTKVKTVGLVAKIFGQVHIFQFHDKTYEFIFHCQKHLYDTGDFFNTK